LLHARLREADRRQGQRPRRRPRGDAGALLRRHLHGRSREDLRSTRPCGAHGGRRPGGHLAAAHRLPARPGKPDDGGRGERHRRGPDGARQPCPPCHRARRARRCLRAPAPRRRDRRDPRHQDVGERGLEAARARRAGDEHRARAGLEPLARASGGDRRDAPEGDARLPHPLRRMALARERGATGQRICLWTVPVVGAIWVVCFLVFPGFTPPLSPPMPAEAVAAFYAEPHNLARTRYGMILFNWFGIGFLPFYGLITVQMKRMAHNSEVLAYGFLATAMSAATLLSLTIL